LLFLSFLFGIPTEVFLGKICNERKTVELAFVGVVACPDSDTGITQTIKNIEPDISVAVEKHLKDIDKNADDKKENEDLKAEIEALKAK